MQNEDREPEQIVLTERISYIPSSKEPLSSDVILIDGDEFLYLFDVGANAAVADWINTLPKKKKVVISHFHEDHTGNIKTIELETVYAGGSRTWYDSNFCSDEEAKQKLAKYQNVTEKMVIQDGIRIEIYPLPCSHAKGSLLVQVEETYIFLGDALYPQKKGEKYVYNVQLLHDEIERLKQLKGEKVFLSHEKRPIKSKNGMIRFLESVYAKRIKNETYIER